MRPVTLGNRQLRGPGLTALTLDELAALIDASETMPE